MDEEEELENTLIGQQEEAPAMDTGDALMGKPSFLPYADDVAPSRVNALSVFTPGGDLKTGIDVNAITPAPTTLPAPSDVSTALNQEVPVGSPDNNDPSFMSRLGSLFNPSGTGGAGLPPTFTPPSEGATQATAGTDISPITLESLGLESPQQRIFKEALEQGGTTQAPPVESALGATPSVAPPLEMITAGAQEQPQTAVSPFLQSPDTPSGLGGPLLRGFEMVNDAARGPNAPMGQDATRARLGGMTLNEYLNAPAGTPGVSGLRTDPQGRMITPAVPVSVNNFAPQASGSQVGPAKVPDEIMSQVVRTGAQTAEFRDGNRDGIEDRKQGIFRPNELLGYDAQSNEVRAPGTQQPVNRIPATSQTAFSTGPEGPPPAFSTGPITRPLPNDPPGFGTRPLPNDPASTRPGDVRDMFNRNPAPNLSDFERESLAREARLAARPDFGEAVSDRERKAARGEGLSQADARDLAQGMDPNASEGQRMRALEIQSRLGLGQFKPEKELTDLEKREIESRIRARDAQIKTAQVEQNRPEFAGKVYTVNGVTFAQTSRGGAQVIDTGSETPEQSTAQIQNFEFTLDQIDKAREAYSAGDVDRANDILTAAGIQKNGIDVTANEYFGDLDPQVTPPVPTTQATDTGFTQQQEANIQKVLAANPNSTRADVVGAMEKAGKL